MSTDVACVADLLRTAGMRLSQAVADADADDPAGNQAGHQDAGREAELLLCHVLDRSRSWLFAHGDAVPSPHDVQRFVALVDARMQGRPVAHLLGRRGFWTLDLEVGPATLIPRPETELLVELALTRIPAAVPARVADLGTGSGAIALAIASERPLAQVIAVDMSIDALLIAQRNRARLGIENVTFRAGDWVSPLAGECFELIVSNPPYIATDDPHLQQGDLRFEPHLALASGVDGLDALRHIAATAPAHLRPSGWLLVEHGFMQGAAVRGLFEAAGLHEVGSHRDIEGRERVTEGRVAG